MKRIKILALVLAMGLVSCDDYLDINTSPNNPTEQNIKPELVLPGALSQTFRTLTRDANELGNVWMNNWGGNVNNITGAFNLEFSLQLNNSFRQEIWNNFYLNTANLQNIIDFEADNYENHKAIAMIMKSFYFQYLVDLYGDIPYTEAHQGGLILNPKYDDDKFVYAELYNKLDQAIALIDNATVTTLAVGDADPIFNGDMTQWVKFANTIKLRMLIRQTELAESDATVMADLTSKFADLAGAEFISEDVTINPGYTNTENAKQSPYYNRYGLLSDGSEAAGNGLIRATEHAIHFLDGTTTGVFDSRLTSIYALAPDGTYTGVIQGNTGDDIPDNLSKIGPGLVKSATQDGIIMLASESFFLQSEAVFRGYMGGDAKALFESGIEASFEFHNATASLSSYMTNSAMIDKIGWDGSANKIEAIMTQKWIAMNGVSGIESYIEYTRTGFPVTFTSTVASSATLPKRLPYPTTELAGNSANVPNLPISQIFTQGAFWYVP